MHQAISPVTDRYVVESRQPDRVYAARFNPGVPLLDYTQTHFEARPARPRLVEAAARFVTSKIVGIPNELMDDVLIPAFVGKIDDIVEHRLQRPLVQFADHTPNQVPVATQLAGNIALAKSDRIRGDTVGIRLGGLIRQSHGIGTVGFRALGVRPVPKGPGTLIGVFGRWATNTHYSIPSTQQYKELGIAKEDRKRYNGTFVQNLITAMLEPGEDLPPDAAWRVHAANLRRECVINPVGTKQLEEGGRITIPRAHWATGKLVEALSADILPVYTAFKMDEAGKVVDGHCEVGDIISPPSEGEGGKAVDDYLTKLAAFRSEHEGREVVYADAIPPAAS
jgi:hypothetical protein